MKLNTHDYIQILALHPQYAASEITPDVPEQCGVTQVKLLSASRLIVDFYTTRNTNYQDYKLHFISVTSFLSSDKRSICLDLISFSQKEIFFLAGLEN